MVAGEKQQIVPTLGNIEAEEYAGNIGSASAVTPRICE